jgi:hypothetical protein
MDFGISGSSAPTTSQRASTANTRAAPQVCAPAAHHAPALMPGRSVPSAATKARAASLAVRAAGPRLPAARAPLPRLRRARGGSARRLRARARFPSHVRVHCFVRGVACLLASVRAAAAHCREPTRWGQDCVLALTNPAMLAEARGAREPRRWSRRRDPPGLGPAKRSLGCGAREHLPITVCPVVERRGVRAVCREPA